MMIRVTRAGTLARIALAFSMGLAALATQAQDAAWPGTKAIHMIIPSAPGGGTDFIGRTLSQKLTESAGWTLVPENRAGAAGTLGLSETARAKADGYEMVIGQTANVALAPALMKLSFDTGRDLLPIASAVESAQVFLVNVNSPWKTWADFVKAAKADPSKPMSFGTSGIGSVAHVTAEMVQEASGFKLQHVPFKGSSPAIADLMGGHLDMAGTSVASALPMLQGGKVRALAVTSAKRATALPDVPPLTELGFPKLVMVEWYGVFAPAHTPPAVADRINAEVNKVLQRPDVKAAILAQGQEPKTESRAEFAARVKADIQTSKEVIARAGIKIE